MPYRVVRTLIFFLLSLTALAEVAPGPAIVIASQRRVALVIGNAAYETGRLRNAGNDAADMAATLRRLGFDVTLVRDADHRAMDEAIDAFNRQRRGGDVGLFYYAGHGVQISGENYLVPLKARIQRGQDVRYEAVPVGRVLGAMEAAGKGINIVILDACRDNPYARQWRSSQRGLAVIQQVRGTLIAYATEPGGVALDGDGRNGIYTTHLLRYMTTPGLSIEQVFKRVRASVDQYTAGKQTPWETSSLIGDFSFVSLAPNRDAEVAALPQAPDPQQADARTKITFRSIPAGAEVFLAPVAELGIQIKDPEGIDRRDSVVLRLLGRARLNQTLGELAKLEDAIDEKYARGRTPLQIEVPQGTYVAFVSLSGERGSERVQRNVKVLEEFEEDSVHGPTINADFKGRLGRFYVLELQGDKEELVQIWQKRGASFDDLEKMYPPGNTFAFDDEEQITRLLEGNVHARYVKPILQLLRRGGKVVFRQDDQHRLVVQADQASRAVRTILRFRDWQLAKMGPPAAFPVAYKDLAPQPRVRTTLGPMRIETIEISDRFPPACSSDNQQCFTGGNKEPMLIIWLNATNPTAAPQGYISDDFRNKVFVESDARQLEAVSSGIMGDKYYYIFLLNKKNKSFKLLLPNEEPVSLEFDT